MQTLAYCAFGMLAVLFGVAFTADYWVNRQGRVSSKVAGATNILVGFIPLVTNKLGIDVPGEITIAYFAIFGGTALLAVASVTIYSQTTIVRKGKEVRSTCTWVDVLYRGYTAVKHEIDEAISQDQMRRQEIDGELQAAGPEAIAEFLTMLVDDIFVTVPREIPNINLDRNDEGQLATIFRFAATRMLLAVHMAVPTAFSRFSLRAYDPESDQMVCICCTDSYNKLPSPIKMSAPNMILRSMELGGTAIFSENQQHHQNTGQGTILSPDRKYSEYVTQAIGVHSVSGGIERPQLSVNMDVWPDQGFLLRYLAKAGVFMLVGKAIENLFNSKMFDNKKELLLKQLLCTKDH